MSGKGNSLSRNPNLCASCSSIQDGEGVAMEKDLSETTATNDEALEKTGGAPKAV